MKQIIFELVKLRTKLDTTGKAIDEISEICENSYKFNARVDRWANCKRLTYICTTKKLLVSSPVS